jgi:hypothetical protein
MQNFQVDEGLFCHNFFYLSFSQVTHNANTHDELTNGSWVMIIGNVTRNVLKKLLILFL